MTGPMHGEPTWLDYAGAMIDAINTPGFAERLVEGLRALTPFDFAVIFGYVGSSSPVDLFNDFPDERRALHVSEYQAGPYLLDPFFLASQGTVEPGLYRLSELAPDRFYQGHYYQSYYAQTGLAEEVGFLIPANERCTIVLSLMRKEKRFSTSEMRKLKATSPPIIAACRKHWAGLSLEVDPDAETVTAKSLLEQAFQSFGEGVLTAREREVVELTLRGHSAESIGAVLGISSGTVRIHRRNTYSKLRINSQGELFNGFIRALLQQEPARAL